jgi:hypothetical protein
MQASTVNEQGEILSTEFVSPSKDMATPSVESRSNPNQIITGGYTIATTGTQVDLRAILNNSGVHGEVDFQSNTYGLMHTETLCVSTNEDGEGIIAVRIVSVEIPTGLFQPNNIFFMKVNDNGEGANSDPDQHSFFVLVYYDWFNTYATPQDFIEDFPCSNYYNISAFQTMVNVAQGQIQVR